MKYPIKWVMICGVIGLLVVSVSIILASSYLTSQRVLHQHANDIMETVATHAINETQNYLTPARIAAELTQDLSYHGVIRRDHPNEIEQYFYDQLHQYPRLAGLYLGFQDGSFIYVNRTNEKVPGGFRTKIISMTKGQRRTALIWKDSLHKEIKREMDPDDTFNPKTRPWYTRVEAEGRTIWTEPYVFFSSKQLGITAASPLKDRSDNLLGVVGVDIEIDSISNFLTRLKIGQHGRAFIVNKNGGVVAFPELSLLKLSSARGDEQFRPTTIDELGDVLSQKAFTALTKAADPFASNQSWFSDFQHQNKTYHIMFAPFTNAQWPWILGIYMPEDDYLGAIKRNRALNIIIMLGTAAVGSLIGWVVVQSIVQPMTALQLETQRINQDNLEESPSPRSLIKEIQDTTDAFFNMKAGLKRYRTRTRRMTQDLQTQADDLRRSEARYRNLVEGSVQGIAILDETDQYIYANTALAQMLGYEHSEALSGRLLSDHITPRGYTRIQRFRQAQDRGEPAPSQYEVQGVRADGEDCWLAARFSWVEWEGQSARMLTVVEISERKQLEQDLIRLSEEEQRRLGLELHDGLGQLLMGTSMMSRVLANDLAAQNRPEAATATQISDWVHQALNTAHDVAHGLYPEALATQGLEQALKSLGIQSERLFGITTIVAGEIPKSLLSPNAALHLYRIAQEALTNAVRHGQATTVTIQVEVTTDHLRLEVCDNGLGLTAPAEGDGGMGLRNMRTRAATLEATLTIENASEGGTQVTCIMPLDANVDV